MYTFPNGEIRQSFYLDPNQRNVMVRVLVPDPDAEIWFDNAATTQRGFDRSFQSPPLENGAYSYTIKARWMENGQPVNQERRVELQAGQGTTVDFRVKMGEKVPTPKTPPNGK
jgi:uncharacterized protein (TIGR03000 family)